MRSLVLATWRAYRATDGRLLSAAIAFYVILALAPLGVVVLGITALVIPEAEAELELHRQLENFFGVRIADFVLQAISERGDGDQTVAAAGVGTMVMVYLALRLFTMLRRALNQIWGIRPRPFGEVGRYRFRLLRKRLVGFGMVFFLSVSLIILVVARTVISAATKLIAALPFLGPTTNFLIAFVILATLIALVYRLLPDATIAWRDVSIGAGITAVFLVTGSYLLGIYFGYASPATAYGAAGTLLVLLLWIYYTTQIFLAGAMFTRLWAESRGRGVRPLPYAVGFRVTDQSASTSASET